MGDLAVIPLGVAAYGLSLWLMKIEGIDERRVLLAKLPVMGKLFRPAL